MVSGPFTVIILQFYPFPFSSFFFFFVFLRSLSMWYRKSSLILCVCVWSPFFVSSPVHLNLCACHFLPLLIYPSFSLTVHAVCLKFLERQLPRALPPRCVHNTQCSQPRSHSSGGMIIKEITSFHWKHRNCEVYIASSLFGQRHFCVHVFPWCLAPSSSLAFPPPPPAVFLTYRSWHLSARVAAGFRGFTASAPPPLAIFHFRSGFLFSELRFLILWPTRLTSNKPPSSSSRWTNGRGIHRLLWTVIDWMIAMLVAN